VPRVRYWTVAEADAALPWVRELLARIRSLAARVDQSTNGQTAAREQDLADAIEELTGDGIVLRDLTRGLIDFPALAPSGREYLLCWLDGEDAVTWWHWPDAGFAGRTPLGDPPG
jgi:hypothetical protein